MELKEILHRVDHTLLAQTASWEEIKALCDDAIKYKTASVCIPASYVKQVKEYVKEEMGEEYVYLKTDKENTASAALAKKLGFQMKREGKRCWFLKKL